MTNENKQTSIEHPTDKPIHSMMVVSHNNGEEFYKVGEKNVTKIEPFTKSGMHADIPYIRVYKNGEVHSEFCQHSIVSVYFEISESEGI